MNILGISAFYHDSAACLVQDGKIISAAQEERFTRKKHDQSFPTNAIKWCLEYSNLKGSDIDCIAFYDKPLLKFERLLETYLAYAPCGLKSFNKAMPLWIKQKMWINELMLEFLKDEGIKSVDSRNAFIDLGGELFLENDNHPNPQGHKLIADNIYTYLVEN